MKSKRSVCPSWLLTTHLLVGLLAIFVLGLGLAHGDERDQGVSNGVSPRENAAVVSSCPTLASPVLPVSLAFFNQESSKEKAKRTSRKKTTRKKSTRTSKRRTGTSSRRRPRRTSKKETGETPRRKPRERPTPPAPDRPKTTAPKADGPPAVAPEAEAPVADPAATEAPATDPTEVEAPATDPLGGEAPAADPTGEVASATDPLEAEALVADPTGEVASATDPLGAEAPEADPTGDAASATDLLVADPLETSASSPGIQEPPAPEAETPVFKPVEDPVSPESEPSPDDAGTAKSLPLGLHVGGGIIGTIQSTSGATYDTAAGVGRLELEAGVELSEFTNIFFIAEGISGDGPSANCANFTELNANAGSSQGGDGSDRFHIREAGVELSKGLFTVYAGKLDLTAYVNANEYANDERTQFLSGAFVNDISHVLPRGGYTPGICLVFAPEPITVTLAAASDDNSGDRLFDEAIGIAEVGLAYGGENWGGNFRIHAAVDGARKKTSSEPANDFGCGASFDQKLGPYIGLFGRYGWRETDAIDVDLESSWSAGVEVHSFLPSRQEDTFGVAVGEIKSATTRTTENIVETYYRAPISSATAVSAHVQVLTDPECDPDADTVTAVGFRLHVTF